MSVDNIMDTLITDRTQTDVERARYLNSLWNASTGRWTGTAEEWSEWIAGPRGAYGFNDMNRISQAVAYLTGILGELGYSVAAEDVVPAYNIRLGVNPQNGGTALGGGTFYRGTEITVTAQPSEKYDFAGWMDSEEMISTDLAYTFVVERSMNLTAAFALKQFRVDAFVEPDGSGETSGSGVYDIDTEVTVAASAEDGYVFTHWTEGGEIVADGPEYTFALDRDRTLWAVMTKTHVITVSVGGDDGGSVTGGGTYLDGQTVTVAAEAGEGYEFAGWQENGQVVSEEAVYSFPAGAGRELTAVFVRIYTITLLVDPAGGGAAQGSGTYREGTQVSVAASPESDYRFVAWLEDGNQISGDRIYTFAATEDRTLTAVFEEIPVRTVTAFVDPEGSGTVTGAGQYKEGETATLKALPEEGYQFSVWRRDGEDVGTDSTYRLLVTTKDEEITAVFAEASRLPAGYTELEYIESSGTQYIDAGISPSIIGKIEIDASANAYSSSYIKLAGVVRTYYVTSTSGRIVVLYIQRAGNGNVSVVANYAASTGSPSATSIKSVANNTRFSVVFDLSGGAATVDSTTKSVTVAGMSYFDSASTLYLFGMHQIRYEAESFVQGISAKMYSCKITNASGALIRDFVPCKNPSGAVGMYDVANDKFYANGGSGEFAAGPEV